MPKASPALSPAEVETCGKLSQGVSQAEHESLFFIWVGFHLHLSLDPACWAGTQALALGMRGWQWSPLWQQHQLQPESAAPPDTGGIAGQRESEAPGDVCAWLSMCLCVCDLPMGRSFLTDSRAVPASMETGTHVAFVLTWQSFSILLPLVHFFPFSGPALETTLSSSWDMFGSYNVLHASWIIFYISAAVPGAVSDLWLPFVVISSFVQCLCALMPISLSCARKQQHDRNPLRIFFSFSTWIQAQGGSWGALYEQFSTC